MSPGWMRGGGGGGETGKGVRQTRGGAHMQRRVKRSCQEGAKLREMGPQTHVASPMCYVSTGQLVSRLSTRHHVSDSRAITCQTH
eukprot:2236698-Rhodomonas_salina.1